MSTIEAVYVVIWLAFIGGIATYVAVTLWESR